MGKLALQRRSRSAFEMHLETDKSQKFDLPRSKDWLKTC